MGSSQAVITQAEDIRSYFQGAIYPAVNGTPYPRLSCETPISRLPQDTWASASVPASVRLVFRGHGDSLKLTYRHHEPAVEYGNALMVARMMRSSMAQSFELWQEDRPVSVVPLDPANTPVGDQQTVFLSLAETGLYTLYLPELSCIEITALEVMGGEIEPVTTQPVWLAHGDSITEGWSATASSGCWPAVVARKAGLNMVNLGFAGAARGELVVAEMMASQPADLISISYGTNCWSRIPSSLALFTAGLRAFIQRVRLGHPKTPIIYMSPIIRPDGEKTANDMGATLEELRGGSCDVINQLIQEGDSQLYYLDGLPLVTAEQLVDGVHPDDAGHRAMAEAFLALKNKHNL